MAEIIAVQGHIQNEKSGQAWPQWLLDGEQGIPSFFLDNYSRLQPQPLNSGEAMTIMQILRCQELGERPTMESLSVRIGIGRQTLHNRLKRLEQYGYLRRLRQANGTNVHSFEGLFDALDKLRRTWPMNTRAVVAEVG